MQGGIKLGKKVYQVFMQDELNNLYMIGFYLNLQNAVPAVNEFLETYGVTIDEIPEYASTFGTCFDMTIPDEEACGVMVRGFIYDSSWLYYIAEDKGEVKGEDLNE